jgi:single-stranded-DNA-specific exonuclease
VNTSFCGREWVFINPCNNELIKNISEKTGLSYMVASILLNRGYSEISEIDTLLAANLKNTIPDPQLFLGMNFAIERISRAIISRENIMVFGDYDVDGVTSTYLLIQYLKIIGIDAKYHIPSRFADGYGISSESIQIAIENQIDLFIAVDSGTNSVSEIESAQRFGIDVIVLDHHTQTVKTLPNAVAVVNPNRSDQNEIENSHIKCLCAAGVVFIFIMALNRHLKDANFFKNENHQDLTNFVDVVALGTICDVMELKGINRAFVKHCLKYEIRSSGIKAIMKSFGIESIVSPEDLSFFVGPAINAAGRIGNANLALQLFLEEDENKAYEIASNLLTLNKKRKIIEKRLLEEIMAIINIDNANANKGICVYGENWHEGVIGIVAGKIKDKFGKPAFVITFDSEGNGKGSARSVPGFHLGHFLEEAKRKGIIIGGGGHALAAGFTIKFEQINAFQMFINECSESNFINSLSIDFSINYNSDLSGITKDFSVLEPFGKGLEKPLFCLKKVRIKNTTKTKAGSHLMLFFSGELGDGNIKGIIFNMQMKKDFINIIEQKKDELLDVVGYINYNKKFGGSIIVEDMAISFDSKQ